MHTTLVPRPPAGLPPVPEQGAVAQRLTAALELPTGERQAVMREVVAEHLPYARRIGRAFAPSQDLAEDCEQVASIGLVLAVQRWTPGHSASLTTFAYPTILGELRRYLRDSSWWVRPPRRVQELSARVRRAEDDLLLRLGRPAGDAELTAELAISESDLTEARIAQGGRHVHALDDDELEVLLPALDPFKDRVDEWISLHPYLEALDPRDREVLLRRYLEDQTQDRIAVELGISQAQVSRRLQRTLSMLRAQVTQQAA